MTIQLPTDIENSISITVRSGRFATADDAVAEIVREHFRRQDNDPALTPANLADTGGLAGIGVTHEAAKPLTPAQPVKQPMTEAEFDRYLVATGLLSQLPDTDADFDDPDDLPIEITGEPLSATVIRDRR